MTVVIVCMSIAITIGIFILLIGIAYAIEEEFREGVVMAIIGSIVIVAGILVVLSQKPAGNYTEWKIDSIIEISPVEDEQYVIDTGNEYIFKASSPLEIDDGEQYIIIEKDGDTTIDFEEIGKGETSKCVTFSRNEKSVLGNTLKKTYTKYVFYIPET